MTTLIQHNCVQYLVHPHHHQLLYFFCKSWFVHLVAWSNWRDIRRTMLCQGDEKINRHLISLANICWRRVKQSLQWDERLTLHPWKTSISHIRYWSFSKQNILDTEEAYAEWKKYWISSPRNILLVYTLFSPDLVERERNDYHIHWVLSSCKYLEILL